MSNITKIKKIKDLKYNQYKNINIRLEHQRIIKLKSEHTKDEYIT